MPFRAFSKSRNYFLIFPYGVSFILLNKSLWYVYILYTRQCDRNNETILKLHQMPSSTVLLKIPVCKNIRNLCQKANQRTASSNVKIFYGKKKPTELNSVHCIVNSGATILSHCKPVTVCKPIFSPWTKSEQHCSR